ncbi:hypothetical protein RHSIM_Rhsim02G0254900 [Rhododendron simsii]|uniref:Uncharacterized protein n=1 Tax=Rhododendron simsii TaxID=118357 RepID=A0A834HDT7_RHOSS|nr:hypothetical protein RHSIM_Rhsim02G0254900 [Rhododendron simsii]
MILVAILAEMLEEYTMLLGRVLEHMFHEGYWWVGAAKGGRKKEEVVVTAHRKGKWTWAAAGWNEAVGGCR